MAQSINNVGTQTINGASSIQKVIAAPDHPIDRTTQSPTRCELHA
jgi:hypothetical protein